VLGTITVDERVDSVFARTLETVLENNSQWATRIRVRDKRCCRRPSRASCAPSTCSRIDTRIFKRPTDPQFVEKMCNIVGLNTRRTPRVHAWSDRHLGVHVHSTPTWALRLNRVERWFDTLTVRCIRHREYCPAGEPEQSSRKYLNPHNTDPKPFARSRSADETHLSNQKFRMRAPNSQR